MLICIPDVLSDAELAECRSLMAAARWEDGRATAGPQSAEVKRNRQIPPDCPNGHAAGQIILRALNRHPTFISAALPRTILPPLFNSYGPGEAFGIHIDNAIRANPYTGDRIRTDLSVTLFLSDPADYDGGELAVDTALGSQEVKLPAGHLVLYPASTLHQVLPVMRGERVASFFWLQSMVRDAGQRAMLYDLDQSIQGLTATLGIGDDRIVSLTGVYHNLIRTWADA